MSEFVEHRSVTDQREQDDLESPGEHSETEDCEMLHSPPTTDLPHSSPVDSGGAIYPWSRWVDSLRLRKRGENQSETYVEGWFDGPSVNREDIEDHPIIDQRPWDQASGGSASILGRVKTASMSVPPSSAPRSRSTTINSNSMAVSRRSMESTRSSIFDLSTDANRVMALQRRYVLRELYVSETHYVDDLQTVIQILSSYLTMRPAILHDLQQLYDMHLAFKQQLESVSPHSAEIGPDGTPNRKSTILRKFQSQALLNRSNKRRPRIHVGPEGAEPPEVLLVAKEIDKLTAKFHLYEAFLKSYDVLSEDLALLRQSHAAEEFWNEGIEALQRSIHSTQKRKENERRALTLDDLIAKPMQRVCKYQLLLAEFLRTIPETTYPLTYKEVKKALDRNLEAVARINTVTGDPSLRVRIKRTTILHERLDYGEQAVLENVYQELGPLILCGVLHVVYQSGESIAGLYLVCILFPGYLLLAKTGGNFSKLSLIASIYLSDMTVDDSKNGQGIACLDTPFTWKVIFQSQQNRYELIFSASSAAEERAWKTEILKASVMPPLEVPTISLAPRRFSYLGMPLRPLDSTDGHLLLKRRGSLRTPSPQSPIRARQITVIIKKTHNPIYDTEVRLLHEARESEPARSRSFSKQAESSSPIVLAPPRAQRVRLERSILGLYSQELLPYPGMTLGRGDFISPTLVGKTMMRGLSLRGVFHSRRSASLGKAPLVSFDGSQGRGIEEKETPAQGRSDDAGIPVDVQSQPQKGAQVEVRDDSQLTTPKTPFSFIRRRLTRAASEQVNYEMTGAIDVKQNKSRWLWPRWLSSSTG